MLFGYGFEQALHLGDGLDLGGAVGAARGEVQRSGPGVHIRLQEVGYVLRSAARGVALEGLEAHPVEALHGFGHMRAALRR